MSDNDVNDDLMNKYGNNPDYVIPDSIKKLLKSEEFKKLQERIEKEYKSRKAAEQKAKGGKVPGYRYGTPKGGVKKMSSCRGRKAMGNKD